MDSKYWKIRYKDKWKEGNNREKMFIEFMNNLNIEIKPFGFETLSENYNPDSPEEKGKPDFFIEKGDKKIFFEVTGTSASSVTPDKKIWLRPDKVEYIKKHNLMAFCAHILDKVPLIRFINMNMISDKNIIYPVIRGTKEKYYEIEPASCLSSDNFKEELIKNGFLEKV